MSNPKALTEAHVRRGNPRPLNLALVAVAVLGGALEHLAGTLRPAPCTCNDDPDHECQGCYDQRALDDAVGQLYAVRLFGEMLSCDSIVEPPVIRELEEYLRRHYPDMDPERLAQVILDMIREDDDADADQPAYATAGDCP
jgi:hypothetical protein